ncbi:MAG: HAD family hydrolase [Halobacteriales archaeon]
MYDHYLFDLDGVIVDVEESYRRRVFDAVAEVLDTSYNDRQIERLWHGVGADTREEIIRSWGDDPEEFWRVFDAVDDPARRIEHTYAYDDAEVLYDVPGPVGVVTHSPPELAWPALEVAGIDDAVDEVVCCDPETGYKPDPRPIELCMEGIGASEDTLMVGDSACDVRGAWNAGIDAGHVDRVGSAVEADHRVTDLFDLPGVA